MLKTPKEAIKTLVPPQVYTDRAEYIEAFYQYALNAVPRRTSSTVLLGQRRMGKTEIFKRVVNRLFFEQDHTDPNAVVPVYYSFEDNVVSETEFAIRYVENFLRWYTAFKLRQPDIITNIDLFGDRLATFIKNNIEVTPALDSALRVLAGMIEEKVTMPRQIAVQLPRRVSDRDDSTIAMFLDEFQNTHLPQYSFSVVGFMQEAVESPTCPHFITGSAMTILAKEILGKGALFGRFDNHPIEPLTEYWGGQLALRAAKHYQANLTEVMAPIVATRCGGNPFYITAVIKQAAKQNKAIINEAVLNDMLGVDLSSGFIWAELNDQVTRWIERINEYGITKWVLYLSVLLEGDQIPPQAIQEQLFEKEGKHVELSVIRDVLIRLARGDLLEYMQLGDWFRRIDDPILVDFLKVWGQIEVEGYNKNRAIQNKIKQYSILERQINDQKGYLAEAYLAQILWNGQRKSFPGKHFNQKEDVSLPWKFYEIRQRVRLDASAESEVDVYAFSDKSIWICESKWWETKKVGLKEVEAFIALADKVKEFEGRKYFEGERGMRVQMWLFAHSGVSEKAKPLLAEHNIYWTTRADLDALIKLTGLRKLPI